MTDTPRTARDDARIYLNDALIYLKDRLGFGGKLGRKHSEIFGINLSTTRQRDRTPPQR
jgi:hypothetical protein